jgi:hypothetical protein
MGVSSEPDSFPGGTVALVQYQGRQVVGIKGSDGTWRDGRRRRLAIDQIVLPLFLIKNKEAPTLASRPRGTSRLVAISGMHASARRRLPPKCSPGSFRHKRRPGFGPR